jgi:transposase
MHRARSQVVQAKATHTMLIESILRRLHPLPGFVYDKAHWVDSRVRPQLLVHVRPRRGSRGICSACFQKRPGYDVLAERRFAFVPLWGLAVHLAYAMRRVDCPRCGVIVEAVPWAAGKRQTTHALVWFLASWAKVLSWREVAQRFHSTWDTVFRCVEHAVRWGLAHRNLDAIASIGVDEFAWKKRHKYLTLVYQIDHRCKRLLHVARDRTLGSFNAFFDMLGEERSKAIVFVASDMWQAFRNVVRQRCSTAIHVLDRFHVTKLLNVDGRLDPPDSVQPGLAM